jgi:hypothetical protein
MILLLGQTVEETFVVGSVDVAIERIHIVTLQRDAEEVSLARP